ncbi:MAG: sigma 54-interacting transcriptional regulator [Deltaproteobacteria bacterium]|nr:sigma 54-interacting transcriptional regulator [Deltaproteobacteria bacterium]
MKQSVASTPEFKPVFHLCESGIMQEIYQFVRKISSTPNAVLVTGQTGAGKEHIVRLIHKWGNRSSAPLIDLNCGAIPENLIESQLFGHEKGAFTGAVANHIGLLSQVAEGTLFLDEIGELPLLLQTRLLRVLDTRTFRPVGSTRHQQFTGRVVAATHANLETMVKEGRFRKDLFHRLNVFHVHIPALEKHREDIPGLVQFFLHLAHRDVLFDTDAMAYLCASRWPGNIRQLRNVVERIVTLNEGKNISLKQVQIHAAPTVLPDANSQLASLLDQILELPLNNRLEKVELGLVQKALAHSSDNKSAAARLLGVHRKVIERKLQHLAQSTEQVHLLFTGGIEEMAKSNYSAAAQLFRRALYLIDTASQSDELAELKSRILLKQCICLRSVAGWADNEAVKVYREAISQNLKHHKEGQISPAAFGLWSTLLLSLQLDEALTFAGEYLQQGTEMNNEQIVLQAHIALANTHFWMGNFNGCFNHLNQFIFRYHFDNELLEHHGQDPYVFYMMCQSLCLFHTGRLQDARRSFEQLDTYARDLHHPFSIAISFQTGAWLEYLFGDIEKSADYADRLIDVSRNHQFVFYEGVGMIFKGNAIAKSGDPEAGAKMVRDGFFNHMARNGELGFQSLVRCVLSNIELGNNRLDEAFDIVNCGLDIALTHSERPYLPELYCIRGKIELALAQPDNAMNSFETALALSRQTGALFAELMCANYLTELHMHNGNIHQALQLLPQIAYRIEHDGRCSEVSRAGNYLQMINSKVAANFLSGGTNVIN